MIRAYIVDDESLVRKGLKMIFPWEQHHIEIVGEASSGNQAKAYLEEHPHTIQLLITDITMPGISGLELMHWVREFDPSIQMVVLTCHQDFEYIQEALRIGAIDYIVKTQLENHDLDEMLERIAAKVMMDKVHVTSQSEMIKNEDDFNKSWCSPYWVWLDEVFEDMLAFLADDFIIAEEQVYEAFGIWNQYFSQFPAWGEAAALPLQSKALRQWLIDTRLEVQLWLRQSGYSEEMIFAILKALSYMELHPIEEISQTNICGWVNISKSYFSRSFKEILRIPFVRYVQELRVEAAKKMLLSTNHPVYWISEQCGFTDTRYFSKIFKEMTGVLPSQFRS